MLCTNLLHSMSSANEFSPFFTDERRRAIIHGVFDAYYGQGQPNRVVFDTNRTWTARLSLVAELYPNAKVICCVREVAWIIDSIERLVSRNALQPSRIFNYKTGGSIYARAETLMDRERGLIGLAWTSLREAWFGEHADRLIVVRYESLTRDPADVMRRLYKELNEPFVDHDFNNVIYDEPGYDAELGTPGLHQVRSKVEYRERETCLPLDLFAKYAGVNFWLSPKLNQRGVFVI
jgi:sulfotransferase